MLSPLLITLIFTLLKYVASSGQKITFYLKRFGDYLPPATPNSLSLSPREVKNIISELLYKTSSGMDGIPTKVLKSTPDNVICNPTHIFNLSLRSGVFLNKFKLAKVIPIFRKGARCDVNNYRPISLLSVFSKILEV